MCKYVDLFDPFLLLDGFGSDNPDDYMKGFPWHPHRGIETVTYMMSGRVAHGDSLGNSGVIGPGDCQWMTAGGGIIHQEMPEESGLLSGVQLWVNMANKDKLSPPKYRDIIGCFKIRLHIYNCNYICRRILHPSDEV